jgi:hypothetical protein
MNSPMKAGAVAHSTYSALVQSDVDMTGHVAYALYKRDKLKFCESFAASRQRAPSADELQVFIDSANLSTRISAYRTEAEAALQDFAQEVLEVQLDEQEAAFNARLAGELRAARSFSRAVWENLVANLLAIAVGALVVLVVYGARIGFVPLAADVFGYDVAERASPRGASAPAR